MNKKYAIIHDSLAKEIAGEASLRTRRIRQMKAVLKQSIERNKLLDKKDLQEVKQLKQDFLLSAEEQLLIQKSTRQLILKTAIIAFTIFTLLAITGFALWFKWQSNQEARRAEARRLAFIARQELQQKNATTALQLATLATQYQESPIVNTVLSDAFHQSYHGIPFLLTQLKLAPTTKQVHFLSDTTLLSLQAGGQLEVLNFNGKKLSHFGTFPSINSIVVGHQQILIPDKDTLRIVDFLGNLITKIALSNQQELQSFYSSPNSEQFSLVTKNGQIYVYPSPTESPIIFPKEFEETASIEELQFSKNNQELLVYGKNNTAYGVEAFLYKWLLKDTVFENLALFPYETKDIFILNQDSIVDTEKGWLYAQDTNESFMEAQTRLTKIAHHSRLILSTNSNNEVKLWNKEGKLQAFLKQSEVKTRHIAISKNGQYFLSLAENGELDIWTNKHPLLPDINTASEIISMELDATKTQILLSLADTTVQLLNLEGKKIQIFKEHQAPLNGAIFLNKEQILSFSEDATAIIWKIDGSKLVTLKGHQEDINFATFNPTANLIATCSKDQTVRIWNRKGACLDTLKHPDFIDHIVFSTNGKLFLTACRDNKARIWKQGKSIELIGHDSTYRYSLLQVQFSPDEKRILAASGDGNSILWDLEGHIIQEFKAHSDWVNAIQFSPDGQYLLTASEDRTALLWQLDGEIQTSFIGHTAAIQGGRFSENGQTILTYSTDGTTKLWNWQGELLANYWHDSPIINAYFLPNNQVLTVSKNGIIRLWISPKGIIEYLKANPIPDFRTKEKTKFALGMRN